MALAAVELGLRCSSLLDSEDLYSTALPREPHSSRAVTVARAAARSARPQHLNRLLHVSMWSQQMANAVLRASNHLRTRLLDISQTEAPRVDWLGECVPNAPSSTWPGAFRTTFVRALHAPKRARSTRPPQMLARLLRSTHAGPRLHWIPEEHEEELGRFWPQPKPARLPPAPTAMVFAPSTADDDDAPPPPL